MDHETSLKIMKYAVNFCLFTQALITVHVLILLFGGPKIPEIYTLENFLKLIAFMVNLLKIT